MLFGCSWEGTPPFAFGAARREVHKPMPTKNSDSSRIAQKCRHQHPNFHRGSRLVVRPSSRRSSPKSAGSNPTSTTTLPRITRHPLLNLSIPIAVWVFVVGWTLDALTTVVAMELLGWGLESGPVVTAVMDSLWSAPRWFHDSIGDLTSVVTLGYAAILVIKIATPCACSAVWMQFGLDKYRFSRWWLTALGLLGVATATVNLQVIVEWGGF